jgi:hypothetical protein
MKNKYIYLYRKETKEYIDYLYSNFDYEINRYE